MAGDAGGAILMPKGALVDGRPLQGRACMGRQPEVGMAMTSWCCREVAREREELVVASGGGRRRYPRVCRGARGVGCAGLAD